MGLPESILREMEGLNDANKRELLDFARFLRQKEEAKLDVLMQDIIEENMEAFEELAK